jgi:glycosyltransferase involved in cell wall biosynthesis
MGWDMTEAHPPASLRVVNAMLGRGLGGLEQTLLDYGDALTLAGHEVHAVIHPDAAIRGALEARDTTWHPLPHLGAWDPFAVGRLRELLRTLRPDASFAHGNRAVRLLSRAGFPPAGLSRAGLSGAGRERVGAGPLIGVLQNYKMHCGALTAACHPTQDLKRYARGQGVADEDLYHIPNMVRVPAAPPRRGVHAPPVIGAMGRLVAKKGFDVFIAALARLAAQGTAFRAVLAGDGEDAAALRRLAAENGLAQVLSFPGWVDDKQTFFDGIDIFCLPSHHEPFGIVLLEAMAQALPVVTTASEGPSEIVHDGVDAIIVATADPDALAGGLRLLLADEDRAARLGASAYRLVRDRYDLPRVAGCLDQALRDIVGSAAARGGRDVHAPA